MITAIVNRELYRYEIHSLLKAFYPREEVKVLTQEAAQSRKYQRIAQDPFMEIRFEKSGVTLSFCNGSASTTAESTAYSSSAGSNTASSAAARTAAAPEGVDFTEKSTELKTALKHLLYNALADREKRTLPWGELIGIRPTKIAMNTLLQGGSAEEAAAAMERDHLVSPEKALLSAQIAQRERQILAGIHYEGGYSLYVGIPFCPTTCLYCSFPSNNLALWQDRVDAYLDTLEREVEASSALMKDLVLDTVYIGGGTPTTLEPRQLERLFTMLEKFFPMDRLQEFTVEAGRPDSITQEKLRVIRAHGVSRISVNPQTMNEETLRLIGRRHTVDQVREAFHMCREAGFDNINMDIILGLPGEGEQEVRRTLEEIEKLSPDNLTVHSLALKRGSRMHKILEEKGISYMQDADVSLTDRCMDLAAQAAARMGMAPYYLYRQKNISGNLENVGYARHGKAGMYNILIMEEKQSILALGAGSISKAVFPGGRIERSDNCKDVGTYLENLDEMIDRKIRLGIGKDTEN